MCSIKMLKPLSVFLIVLLSDGTLSFPAIEEKYKSKAHEDGYNHKTLVQSQTTDKMSTIAKANSENESLKSKDPFVEPRHQAARAEGSQMMPPSSYRQRSESYGYGGNYGMQGQTTSSFSNSYNMPMATDVVLLRQILQQQSDIKQLLMHMADRQAILQDSLFRIETHMTPR